MPHLSGKSETDIALSHAVETIECTDPDFPPTSAALFMDPENPPATAPSGADWSRVHGNLYVPEKKLVSILPVSRRCNLHAATRCHARVVDDGTTMYRVPFVIDGCLVPSHVLDADQTFFWTCLFPMSTLKKDFTRFSSINTDAGTMLWLTHTCHACLDTQKCYLHAVVPQVCPACA